MATLRTYQTTRGELVALAVAVATALAVGLGCALPAVAWASVSEAVLGINVNLPSTAQQAPGTGDPGLGSGTGGAKGSQGALGANLRVPDPVDPGENPDPDGKPGDTEGSGTSGAGAVLGVNLQLPSTAQQAPVDPGPGGSGATGSQGVLGANLRVPDPVDPDDNPDPDAKPGDEEGPGATGAEAVLGVNLNVPSTVMQDANAGKGSEAVLGVNLTVQNGIVVSFDAMNGRNTDVSSVTATMKQPLDRPSDPEWPGRTFLGWYTDAACSDGNEWKFVDESAGEGYEPDLVPGSMTLYAKWRVNEPRETGRVVLHMGFGNTVIDEGEAASHGIVGEDAAALGIAPGGYEARPAGDAYASAQDPTYQGSYFLGGKGNVAPDLDGTLDLPIPRMFPADNEGGDGRTSGVFVAWRTEEPVRNGDELVYGGDKTAKIGRFDTGVVDENGQHTQHFWAQWSLTETYDVAFRPEGGTWPNGSADPWIVPVPERQTVSAPANPVREGYDFKGWCTKDAAGALQPFDLRNPIERDTDLYARWTESTVDPPEPPKEKLDVTVPVSVGFAVNADTGEVTTPDMGAYAVKSRSERPVAVERLDLTTRRSEMEGFFSLDGDAWEGALRKTLLLLRSDRAQGDLRLAFARAGAAGGPVWESGYALTQTEKDGAYTIDAFDPTGADPGEQWWLTDACNRLNLKFGMEVPEELKVRTDIDGQRKITHLKVTVATVP